MKKEKFTVTSKVASLKAGDVVELDPDNIPMALQAHVARARPELELTVNPLQKKVDELEQELEDLLREKYEALYGEKAGGNSKLSTIRAKIKDKEAE